MLTITYPVVNRVSDYLTPWLTVLAIIHIDIILHMTWNDMKENYFPITKDVWVICSYVSKTYSFF